MLGARQFWRFESDGTEPDNPEPYYLDLRGGKMGRQYAITEMAKSFFGKDWFGWDYIERMFPKHFVKELRAALGQQQSRDESCLKDANENSTSV